MKLDFGQLAGEAISRAEGFLRRHVKSKAVRDAEERQKKRKAEAARARWRQRLEAARIRITRAGLVAGTSGGALVGYGAMVAPVGTTALVAAAGASAVAAGAALLWPTRIGPPPPDPAVDLELLLWETEAWLLEQRTDLPRRTDRATDTILGLLDDIRPSVPTLDPEGPLAGDIRRLAGNHLKRLVEAYLELPATTRERRPDAAEGLIASLDIVAEELSRLSDQANRDRLLQFETQKRFLKSRYKDEGFGL